MTTPRYVPFEVAPGVLFALWSGRSDEVTPQTPRCSEIGLMVPRSTATVDTIYATWTAKGVTVIEEPHDDVFGRTFVITDPDGNLIRVSPIDRSLRPEPSQAAWDNRMRSVPAVPEVVPVAGDVVQGGQPVEDDPLERSWKLFS